MTWLLGHWRLGLIVLAVVVAVLLGGKLWGRVAGWWTGIAAVRQEDQATLQEIRDTKEQLATSQGAILEMSKRIGVLTQEAIQAKARAVEAEGRAQRWAVEASQLRDRVTALEAARRAQAAPRTAVEAAAALRALGYAAEASP
ncbi:MAG: hypothetical protein HY727_15105 [Candidatus Rokubacteria bacterium]|nr:hypothetical protein [Candidatus Rokubacteria bacterium]